MEFEFDSERRRYKGYTAQDGPCIMAEITWSKAQEAILLVLTPVTLAQRNGFTSLTYDLFSSQKTGLRKRIESAPRYSAKTLQRTFERWAQATANASALWLTDQAQAMRIIDAEEARDMELLAPVWKSDPAENHELQNAAQAQEAPLFC